MTNQDKIQEEFPGEPLTQPAPTMAAREDGDRKAFEACLRTIGFADLATQVGSDGDYLDYIVKRMLDVWIAASAHERAKALEPVRSAIVSITASRDEAAELVASRDPTIMLCARFERDAHRRDIDILTAALKEAEERP